MVVLRARSGLRGKKSENVRALKYAKKYVSYVN